MKKYQKINYKDLSPKQQENYNFHKVSSILADYGTKSAEAYGNMVSQAQAGQEKIDDIIRQNQNQAFQLRQMEEA